VLVAKTQQCGRSRTKVGSAIAPEACSKAGVGPQGIIFSTPWCGFPIPRAQTSKLVADAGPRRRLKI